MSELGNRDKELYGKGGGFGERVMFVCLYG